MLPNHDEQKRARAASANVRAPECHMTVSAYLSNQILSFVSC